jgi:hypothetical protein
MPVKGTSGNYRSPEKHRSRSDGLAPGVQKQLLIDLELKGDGVLPIDIVKHRPAIYGDPKSSEDDKLRKAVSDRIRYLRKLKQSSPKEYWELYARALNPINLTPPLETQSEIGITENSDTEGEEKDADDNASASHQRSLKPFKRASASASLRKLRPPKVEAYSVLSKTMDSDAYDCKSRCATYCLIALSLTLFIVVFEVSSADVERHVVLPGLLLFRLLDEPDDKHRLHHAYQFAYQGDPQLAIVDECLGVTVISSTAVSIVMPACSDVWMKHFKDLQQKMKKNKKLTLAGKNSQTTLHNYMLHDKDLQTFKVLVLFDKTGEELTNAVFSSRDEPHASPEESRYGRVKPKAVLLSSSFEFNGRKKECTTLYSCFTIARVEKALRMEVITEPTAKSNELAEDLAEGMEGMSVGSGADEWEW